MRSARVLGLSFLAFAACGAPQERSHIEDQTRRVAPLPACVFHLPARRSATAGTMRHLREEEIIKLMFPAFDEEKHVLPKDSPTCTGARIFLEPALSSGTPVRAPWPWTEQEGDVLYGSGGDRIKIAWLRVVSFPDGSVAGPLAMVRGTERFAELFAIGPYRGRPERVKLGTERMGGEILVTAEDDQCTGRKPNEPCETSMTVFLPRMGGLARVVDVPIERVAYAAQGERGAEGTLEYRLTSVAQYRDDGIHLVEQIRVADQNGVELRKAERERLFVLNESGTMTTNVPPLWDSAVKAKIEKRETPPARPPRHP